MKVGFIGLGAMGFSMAGHLRANGLLAVVGNRSQAKAEEFARANGVVAAGAAADFADCDVVMLC
ncbi:MAG: NAD(P)-binding domain-containing protein, partial [Arenimonas sp.]